MKSWWFLIILILSSLCGKAFTEETINITPNKLNSPLQQYTVYFNNHWLAIDSPEVNGYYRIIISAEKQGLIIQDFYQKSRRKQSDPFMITQDTDLDKGVPQSIEGNLLLWHENGQQHLAMYYKEGLRQGLLTVWYDNGEKELEQYYRNNKEEGYAVYWNRRGERELEVFFIEGEPQHAIFWGKSQKISNMYYKKGKKEGLSTYWDRDGNRFATKMYKNDQLNGPYIEYFPNQQKQLQMNYQNDKLKNITLWYNNGQKAAFINSATKQISCQIWDEKGNFVYSGTNNERCMLTLRNILVE